MQSTDADIADDDDADDDEDEDDFACSQEDGEGSNRKGGEIDYNCIIESILIL